MVREVPLSRGSARPRGRRAGVTLLEILVAVAVLAVGLSTIFQIFPMGFAASSKSASQTIAYELAAQKMEDARNNFLFGGIPSGSSAAPAAPNSTSALYYGSQTAPNPDLTTYKEVNTNGTYQEFSTTSVPEKNYFYRVECVPVIDPARKYQEYPFEQGGDNSRGFATMYRITVTVRGPVQTKAEAQDPVFGAGLARKGSVQVKLATYVANKTVGEAKLAANKIVRRKVGGNVTLEPEANIIFITGSGTTADTYPYPENFTVFSRAFLCPNEIEDGGPTLIEPATRLPQTPGPPSVNILGLDNIVIFRADPDDTDDGATSTGGFIAESNKVIAIYGPDDPGRSASFPSGPSASSPYVWQLTLMKSLYGRDNDFPSRETPTSSGGFGSTRLVDSTYDADSVVGSRGVNEDYGYPAGTQVRGLIHLERRP